MKKTTLRLPEHLVEDLKEQAADRDESFASYVRDILSEHAESPRREETHLRARLDHVERRLDALETAVGPTAPTDGTTDGAIGTDVDGTTDGNPTASAVSTDGITRTDGATDGTASAVPTAEPMADDPPADLVALVEDANWDDVMVGRTDARTRAIARILDDLRDGEVVQSARIRGDLDLDYLGLSDSSAKRMISDVLGDLDVVARDGYSYRWSGRQD